MATKAIITDYGRSQIAQALAGDYKITISAIVLGTGIYTDTPKASQTSLLHQVGSLTGIGKEVTGSWIYYTGRIPYSLTNVTITEMGVVDSNNKLILIAAIPAIELIESSGGVLKDIPIRLGVTTAIGDVLIVQAPTQAPVFTNDSLGVLQGIESDGYIYRADINDIGYGKVYNWENTFKKVSTEPQEVSATTVYLEDTYSYYKDSNNITKLFWHCVNNQIAIGNTDSHLHFNTNIPDNTRYGDHITATTPNGDKAVAWLDDLSGFSNYITHYAFNSGVVLPSSGEPDYAYINDMRFGIKSGTTYTDNETTHTLESMVFATLDPSDTTNYNVYIESNVDTYQILYKDNTEFRQRQCPTVAEEGDYWLCTLEPLQAYWCINSGSNLTKNDWVPTNAVYCFRLTRGTAGFRYALYEGSIGVDFENQTLILNNYTIITPENLVWRELETGIIEDPEITHYPITTVSDSLVAVMPDYAWNGYNVNMRTLQDWQAQALPDMIGHAGQILMSDGTKAYWTTINALLENSLANNESEQAEDDDLDPPSQPVID